jgi:hypothetical protein
MVRIGSDVADELEVFLLEVLEDVYGSSITGRGIEAEEAEPSLRRSIDDRVLIDMEQPK